jgi:hypothetical protein
MKPDYETLKTTCNLWRNYGDIEDSHASVEYVTKYFAEQQHRIQPHNGPGHWNDPDTVRKMTTNIKKGQQLHLFLARSGKLWP